VENTKKENGCDSRLKVESCDRLLAMAAVKLGMFECSYISEG
jgi:hypothetical protein